MVNSYPFTPFFGIVEDVNDPEQIGRIRVRVHGFHSQVKQELPVEMLKWMYPIVNNSASLQQKGQSATGYIVGTTVYGKFIDPDCQDGIIEGALPSLGDMNDLAKGNKEGKSAVDREVKTGIQSVNVTWDEPESDYGTVYPNNNVFESPSGHTIEIDDTQGKERINIYHTSGSFIEMFPDGRVVSKHRSHKYSITYGNENIFVQGDCNITVNGNCNLQVEKDLNQHIKGNVVRTIDGDLTEDVKGNIQESVGGEFTTQVGGNYNQTASSNVNINGSNINLN